MYMMLNPCPSCGDEQFSLTVHMILVDDDLLTRYAGPCRTCATPREFTFDIEDEFAIDGETLPLTPGEPEFGRAKPSTIIDAGQWLTCADNILAGTPTNILGVSEEEWQTRRYLFKAAAESVGEVLKFIPADGDDVPSASFWTDDGRAARDQAPDRFRRAGLEQLRLACLDLAARYSS
jgi:hypothetical protein